MFSNNRKISAGQLQALLLTDWTAKIMLIVPEMTAGAAGKCILIGAVIGILSALLAGWFIVGMADVLGSDYYTYVRRRTGRHTSEFLYLIYAIYFLCHISTIFYLCGQIAKTFLLPDVSFSVLILVPGFLGYYLARGGQEVRGRVSEMTAFIIWGVFLLMLILTVPEIHVSQLVKSGGRLKIGSLLKCTGAAFSGFGALGVLPLALPMVEKESLTGKELKKRIRKAIMMTGSVLILIYVISLGTFGLEGMARLKWPVISLMSCTSLPGVFLQRWDVILIGFLLFGMFLSAGGGIYYMGVVGRTFRMGEKRVMQMSLLVPWLLCLWMEKNEEVLRWCGKIIFSFCMPVIFGIAVVLGISEWLRRGRKREN